MAENTVVPFMETNLYKAIKRGNPSGVFDTLNEYCVYSESMTGADLNIMDPYTGGSYLHLMIENAHLFKDPPTVTVIYGMACMGINIDAQDFEGNTCLHNVMEKEGAYRILVALMRCGIDPEIRNNDNKTAEEILLETKPEGWQEMLLWYNKFKPGLWQAMLTVKPNLRQVELLLQSWCRVTIMKNGKIVNLRVMAQQNPYHIHCQHLMEKYENTIEFSLACLSGRPLIIKSWISKQLMENIDVNACDKSFSTDRNDSKDVGKPLIAEIWETNNYAMVNILMDLKVDVHKLYNSEEKDKGLLRPLFFYLICSPDAPQDHKIIVRVLKDCNLSLRNQHGQTIIYEAIARDKPLELIQTLLHFGLDVSLRDSKGRTARDFAKKLNKDLYVDIIDQHILELIRKGKTEMLQRMILRSYQDILLFRDSEGNSLLDISRSLHIYEICEILMLAPLWQEEDDKIYQYIKEGDLQNVKKLMKKKSTLRRDKCGRSVLLYALLNQQKSVAEYLITEHPILVNEADSYGRTPLHYSFVLFEDTSEISHLLKLLGADVTIKDNRGKTPNDYYECNCTMQFACIKKSICEFELEVFLEETSFEESFFSAIQANDLDQVKELVEGLHKVKGISRYSSRALFTCLDNNHEELAKFLVLKGFRTNIWKQYEPCSSDDPMCGMMECSHRVTYLKEKVEELKMYDLLKLIEDVESGKVKTDHTYPDPPVYCP
ncbi:Ankyrin repeat [Octopus vulgaris]|uniref:Ankyrin repeat n=1 Tax=Octopus vulgaris TaxID=6645 RepID=A0AA36BH31_OCTVU|nr:Ankyrin repeat [Octopus vulgaris]